MSQLNKAKPNSSEDANTLSSSSAVSTTGHTASNTLLTATLPQTDKSADKKYNALTEPNSIKEKKKRAALYSENLPTFYVGQGNNSEL